MTRETYINELRIHLRGLQESDIEDAVAYCEEYFNEAEDEEQAIKDLGSPVKFAAQIKTETAFKTTQNPNNYRKPHSMMKSILMIIGGICALPIALPLLFTAVILIFVFGFVICIFVLAGIICTIALFYAAIATFIGGFIFASGAGDVLFHIGASLIFLGLAILLVLLVTVTIRKGMPLFMDKLSEFYHRHKRGGQQDEN